MRLKKSLLTLTLLLANQAFALSPLTIQKGIDHSGKTPVERLILGNTEGLSLYTFKPDRVNESTCYDDCAKVWPPVIISQKSASSLSGSLGTAPRKDGSLQLTVDGHPVYLFQSDRKPGDMFGEGLGDVWFVLDLNIKR